MVSLEQRVSLRVELAAQDLQTVAGRFQMESIQSLD
jgi:hypothetical protein